MTLPISFKSIEDMPAVLMVKFCKNLSYSDVATLTCVNRKMKVTAENSSLWASFCQKQEVPIEGDMAPKKCFKLEFLRRGFGQEKLSFEKISDFLRSGGNPNVLLPPAVPCFDFPPNTLLFTLFDLIGRINLFNKFNHPRSSLFIEALEKIEVLEKAFELVLSSPKLDINFRIKYSRVDPNKCPGYSSEIGLSILDKAILANRRDFAYKIIDRGISMTETVNFFGSSQIKILTDEASRRRLK